MTGSALQRREVEGRSIWRGFFLFVRCLLYAIILLNFSAQAQDGNESFCFKHITVSEGLSHSDAMCVAEDKAGFIWIGTNKGIDRYEGYRLKKYELPINEQKGLSGNRIRAFQIDKSGTLWVGAEGAGLFCYNADLERFQSLGERNEAGGFSSLVLQLTTANLNAITLDKLAHIWVGTDQDGLFEISFNGSKKINSIRQIRLDYNLSTQPFINKLAGLCVHDPKTICGCVNRLLQRCFRSKLSVCQKVSACPFEL